MRYAFINVYRHLCSLHQVAYYPSCWLIVEPEKLKLNTFSPLIRGVTPPLPPVKPSSSLVSQNYISPERKDLG